MSQEIRNQLPKEIFFSYREGSNGYSCLDYGYEGDVKYIREDVTAELLESEREKSEKLVSDLLRRIEIHIETNEECIDNFNMDAFAKGLIGDENRFLNEIIQKLTEYKTTSK